MNTVSNNMIAVHPLDPPTKTSKMNTPITNDIHNDKNPATTETTASKLLKGYPLPAPFHTRYSLGQELGSGGFGFVISVKERSTGIERAVKFIYKNKVPASAWVHHQGQDLPIEIYILKYIQHESMIGYVDSFEDDTYFYLVMELHGSQWNQQQQQQQQQNSSTKVSTSHLPGLSHTSDDPSDDDDEEEQQQEELLGRRGSCDLFECIEQHRSFDESLAKIIFRQIVECVAHLDNLGICHRDIKDENIVIDSNYKVKLIDFGSAVALPRHYQPSQRKTVVLHRKFYGTIAFASPEILRMEPYEAEPAEVWSLGVLLYTLVFGQVPFSTPRMALAALYHTPPTLSKTSSKCLHLIACLLEKSPQRRPTVHQILTHPWLRQH
ncbi:kinase-like domain-containing protein [Chlamydoabsidia padenii]|nr:kinase-like domain-containing protein [Chlamydoabsidia padenii]